MASRPERFLLASHQREHVLGWLGLEELFVDHMVQVAFLSLELFCELEGLHGEAAGSSRLLQAAALCHDVGYAISPQAHHKHSRDLILERPIPGFDEGEMMAIASLARYHRKAEPSTGHKLFAKLGEEMRETVRRMAALLRVADGFDRSHQSLVRGVSAAIETERVVLHLDVRHEIGVDLWAADRKKGYFERVYGKALVFEPLIAAAGGSGAPDLGE